MSVGQELVLHLPFLRRYTRALARSQRAGDSFVRATLEAANIPRNVEPRLALYFVFQRIWLRCTSAPTNRKINEKGEFGLAISDSTLLYRFARHPLAGRGLITPRVWSRFGGGAGWRA